MPVEDLIKTWIKEITNVLEENIDIRDEKWYIKMGEALNKLKQTLNILENE